MFDPEARKQLGAAMRFGVVGLEMATAIGVGAFVGHRVDRRFETSPLWTLVGVGVGVLVGFIGLWRLARRAHMDGL